MAEKILTRARALVNQWLPTSEIFGGVAQLGEHLLCKQGVIGSIPFISTMPKGKKGWIKTRPRYGLIAQLVRAHA